MNNLTDHSFVVKKMITTAYLSIFLNYSQTIAILNSLHLNWQSNLIHIFDIYKAIAGGLQEIISIECFMTGFKYYFLQYL